MQKESDNINQTKQHNKFSYKENIQYLTSKSRRLRMISLIDCRKKLETY